MSVAREDSGTSAFDALLSAAELVCRAELGIFFFDTVAVPLLPTSQLAAVLELFALGMGDFSKFIQGDCFVLSAQD